RKMLRADLVPCSHDAALQEAESVLDCIGMNVRSEAYIFLLCVIYRLMPIAQFAQSLWVGCQFIGHDHIYILRYVLLNVFGQSPALCIPCMKESQIAISLPDADYNRFIGSGLAPSWV